MNKIYLIISLFLLAGCKQSFTPMAYVNQFNDSKSDRTSKIDKETFSISLVSIPLDFYIAETMILDSTITRKEVKLEQSKAMKTSSFELRIHSSKGLFFEMSKWSRADQMTYYSTSFKNDISAVTFSGDTISCSSLLFESPNQLLPSAYFELGFNLPESEIKSLVIDIVPLNEMELCIPHKISNKKQPKLRLKK